MSETTTIPRPARDIGPRILPFPDAATRQALTVAEDAVIDLQTAVADHEQQYGDVLGYDRYLRAALAEAVLRLDALRGRAS